jgi:carboxymethylenebutenolidase
MTMQKLTKEDISQEVFDLYDDYYHNKIDRRRFVEKIILFAVALTVPSLLSFMTPNYLDSILIKPGDPRLKSEYITYESPKGGGKIKALLSQSTQNEKKTPQSVHENRGLNPYIEDVGRRAAIEGFITLAPDALSPLGGYPGNDDDGRELQKNGREEMLEDFIAAYNYLNP